MTILLVAIGMLGWLGIMLLLGEWLLTRDWPVQHRVSGDGQPWIASDASGRTEMPRTPAHAGDLCESN